MTQTQERRVCAATQCARTVPASRGARAKTCSKECSIRLRAERMRAYNAASRARRRDAKAIAHGENNAAAAADSLPAAGVVIGD